MSVTLHLSQDKRLRLTMIRSSFKGFTGGDVEPPHQPESPPYDEGDENLPVEEFIKKHAISDESKAELRRSLKAEWTPKLLGKKYVKNTSDDPQVGNSAYAHLIEMHSIYRTSGRPSRIPICQRRFRTASFIHGACTPRVSSQIGVCSMPIAMMKTTDLSWKGDHLA